MKKVAIYQNTLTGGGRIKVVNEIIRLLNDRGIIPDVVTLRTTPSLISGGNSRFRIIKLPELIRGFYEIKVISLNLWMRHYARRYDLLINSNNTFLFAPCGVAQIAYVHFPREARVLSRYESLAFPDGRFVADMPMPARILRKFTQWLHTFRKLPKHQTVLANSKFTAESLTAVYPDLSDIEIVYPPVELDQWTSRKHAGPQKRVVSLGRFSPDKRQLEQLRIAARLPNCEFQIIGFVGDRQSQAYYDQCRAFIRENALQNVRLYPGLSQKEARNKLRSAALFIHSTRNEPFGISTVEAIAAGCIPLVHDSGGQREVVPEESLRYNSVNQAVEKLTALLSADLTSLQSRLKNHILQFDVNVFRDRMNNILTKTLDGN